MLYGYEYGYRIKYKYGYGYRTIYEYSYRIIYDTEYDSTVIFNRYEYRAIRYDTVIIRCISDTSG